MLILQLNKILIFTYFEQYACLHNFEQCACLHNFEQCACLHNFEQCACLHNFEQYACLHNFEQCACLHNFEHTYGKLSNPWMTVLAQGVSLIFSCFISIQNNSNHGCCSYRILKYFRACSSLL